MREACAEDWLLLNLSFLSTSAPAVSFRADRSVSRRGTCDRKRHESLRAASRDSPVRVRRPDSPTHLLVRRSAIRVTSHLPYASWSPPPALLLMSDVSGRARTIYVGPEEPANASSFAECYLGKAGEVSPDLFSACERRFPA